MPDMKDNVLKLMNTSFGIVAVFKRNDTHGVHIGENCNIDGTTYRVEKFMMLSGLADIDRYCAIVTPVNHE